MTALRQAQDERGDICCPERDRIEPLRTVAGDEVADAHMHKGLVKGTVLETQSNRTLFWYRNGRLTPARETPLDLRRALHA